MQNSAREPGDNRARAANKKKAPFGVSGGELDQNLASGSAPDDRRDLVTLVEHPHPAFGLADRVADGADAFPLDLFEGGVVVNLNVEGIGCFVSDVDFHGVCSFAFLDYSIPKSG